ncbi:MAG: AsmA family protein, partial [Bacteroidota bacterium]
MKLKKILKILSISLLAILLLLIATPFLFKDKIKALVQESLDEYLLATVQYEDVDLSFIRNFPKARLAVYDFSVVGQEDFAGDTLIQGKEIDLVVDLWSLISGEEINLKRVSLQ